MKILVSTFPNETNACKPFFIATLACAVAFCMVACRSHQTVKIAVIPQTEVTSIWEDAHVPAVAAARVTGTTIDWKAPMREDDIEAQIALVDRVAKGNYQGLVLAPNQAVSLISPVQRAVARGIRTVIIGSPLRIPARGNLLYVLNDDVKSGQLAAERVARLLNGHGTVALLGINPDVTAIMIRARAFEQDLYHKSPGIAVVERRLGSFNVPHEQQVAEDVLRDHPNLDVLVALMSSTVEGTLAAVGSAHRNHGIKVIGFDSSIMPSVNVDTLTVSDQDDSLDCVIQEDTIAMAQRAIELIGASLRNEPVPSTTLLPPKLITRDDVNAHLAQIRDMVARERDFIRSRWSPIE